MDTITFIKHIRRFHIYDNVRKSFAKRDYNSTYQGDFQTSSCSFTYATRNGSLCLLLWDDVVSYDFKGINSKIPVGDEDSKFEFLRKLARDIEELKTFKVVRGLI